MFKTFVDVRLNNSNLTLCIPQKLVTDWNENTWYDGNHFYIRKGISKATRRHIAIVDRMLKMECSKMGEELRDQPIDNPETGPNLTSTSLQDHTSCKFFLTYEAENMQLTRGSLFFTRYLMRRLRLYLII